MSSCRLLSGGQRVGQYVFCDGVGQTSREQGNGCSVTRLISIIKGGVETSRVYASLEVGQSCRTVGWIDEKWLVVFLTGEG